ncbi:acyl-CoA carboxylase subunit epsilon, partial [Klebsiella pneumoniae]|nr:acyl-CoA carboxylase subunit epsilon [Klebsiella pneumoniae]
MTAGETKPTISVSKAQLTDEELGALVTVLAAVLQPAGNPHAPGQSV